MADAQGTPSGVEAVAEACNLSPRRVQQLADEGVFPRAERGAYDLDACLRAYVRYLQQALSSKGSMGEDGEVLDTKSAKAQLTQYQADLKKLELAQRRGSVIAITDHEAVLSTLIVETKARVMAIAPRVAPKVLGQTSRLMVQATIEEEAKLALTELAQRTPALPAPAGDGAPATPPPARKRARKSAAKKTPAKQRSRSRAAKATKVATA